MIRGTTPRLKFTLPFDTSQIAESYITFSQDETIKMDKSLEECEAYGNTLTVVLTQEETLSLASGKFVEIQVRVKTVSDDVLASNIIRVNVDRILREGVI